MWVLERNNAQISTVPCNDLNTLHLLLSLFLSQHSFTRISSRTLTAGTCGASRKRCIFCPTTSPGRRRRCSSSSTSAKLRWVQVSRTLLLCAALRCHPVRLPQSHLPRRLWLLLLPSGDPGRPAELCFIPMFCYKN